MLVPSASCFAREAAVGAMRCELMLAGLVVSRGLGFAAGAELLLENDSRDVLAAEAAVGAASELRLALRVTSRAGAAFGESEDLFDVGDLAISGDLRLPAGAALLEESTETGLGLVLSFRLLVEGTEIDF